MMRDRWTPFVLQAEDDWTSVTNRRNRKTIQNRLSQRARRLTYEKGATLRQREQGAHTALMDRLAPMESDTAPKNTTPVWSPLDAVLPLQNVLASDGWPVVEGDESHDARPTSCNRERQPSLSDFGLNYLVLAPMELIAAYTSIASLLKIACSPPSYLRTFSAFEPSMPSTLVPTPSQTVIPHPPFVDIIPFPGLRNRILTCINVIDLGALSRDLTQDAFSVWSRDPWDATGWEISERFAKSWWFLIDEESLKTTNFWRSQKSEKMLVIDGHGNVITTSETAIDAKHHC